MYPNNIISGVSFFLSLITPALIGFLPIFLHLIDKMMEAKFSPLREEILRAQMSNDKREKIAAIGKSPATFRGVRTYFEYERSVHFIVAISVFNIISLYFAQIQCTNSFLRSTVVTLIGIVAIAIFLVAFLVKVVNRAFAPAAVRPVRNWLRASCVAFLAVMLIEIGLHWMHSDICYSGPENGETHPRDSG